MTSKAPFLGTLFADALLLGAAIVIPLAGFALLPPPEEIVSRPDAPLPDIALLEQACAAYAHPLKRDCLLDGLTPVISSHGVSAAFGLLEAMTLRDPYVFAQAHPMAHELGRNAYLVYGNALTAFAECPFTLASGCPHGILEAYLSSRSEITPEDVRAFCPLVRDAQGPFAFFQCLHGMGHGLTMALKHDLFAALERCDYLLDSWQRDSCYGGVFMENTVSFQIASGLGVGEGTLHAHPGDKQHNGTLKREDPVWPCNSIEERYKFSCYDLQSTAFLTLNGYNVAAAFDTCSRFADPDYIWVCYKSMGRDISSITNRDPQRSLDQCAWGEDDFEAWCVVGVARDFANREARGEPGLALCAFAKTDHKKMCYEQVGDMIFVLLPDPLARTLECEKAEPAYRPACRTGARV